MPRPAAPCPALVPARRSHGVRRQEPGGLAAEGGREADHGVVDLGHPAAAGIAVQEPCRAGDPDLPRLHGATRRGLLPGRRETLPRGPRTRWRRDARRPGGRRRASDGSGCPGGRAPPRKSCPGHRTWVASGRTAVCAHACADRPGQVRRHPDRSSGRRGDGARAGPGRRRATSSTWLRWRTGDPGSSTCCTPPWVASCSPSRSPDRSGSRCRRRCSRSGSASTSSRPRRAGCTCARAPTRRPGAASGWGSCCWRPATAVLARWWWVWAAPAPPTGAPGCWRPWAPPPTCRSTRGRVG